MSTFAAKKLIQDSVTIPTIPTVLAKINALVDDPEVGTREIGEAVAEDPPTAAKVLKIANSAFYGLRERVLSTEHATAVLGVRVLRNIAMQAAVISQFEHLRDNPHFNVDDLWKHSILCGQASSILATKCRARIGLSPEEFYVVGLLHDMGKVVMLDGLGEEYVQVIVSGKEKNKPLHVAEEETLGFNHTDVGALVATRWGLPSAVASAIQFHHGPRESVESDPVVALIANVNLLVHRVADAQASAARTVFCEDTLRFLGVSEEAVSELVDEAFELLPQIQV